jgi:lysyl-tRNA synthetase class 2
MSRKKAPSPPLAPSDLVRRKASAAPVRVGGRVALATAHEIKLADAFTLISARASGLGAEPGDLLVLSGRWDGRVLTGAKLISRAAYPPSIAGGEFARQAWQGVGSRLRARARAFQVMREYFASEDFLEIDPPARVPAPGVDLNVEALRAEGGFLVTSPELQLKRLLVGGVPRCFSLSHAFRRDEQGSLHEPEFMLLEWYRAFAGQADVQRDTEQLVSLVAKAVRGKPELIAPDGRRLDARPPFARVSVAEAFAKHAHVRDVATLAADNPARYFELLVERVEPALAGADQPIFLCDYPLSQAALARPKASDPRFAERFELYAGGVELCNGYGELTDGAEQRRRFALERAARAKSKRRVYPLDRRFLAALDEGMPPAGGNALGVDRLLLLATGAKCVQDVMALPWEPR